MSTYNMSWRNKKNFLYQFFLLKSLFWRYDCIVTVKYLNDRGHRRSMIPIVAGWGPFY